MSHIFSLLIHYSPSFFEQVYVFVSCNNGQNESNSFINLFLWHILNFFPQSLCKIRYDDVIFLYYYHFLSSFSSTKTYHFKFTRGKYSKWEGRDWHTTQILYAFLFPMRVGKPTEMEVGEPWGSFFSGRSSTEQDNYCPSFFFIWNVKSRNHSLAQREYLSLPPHKYLNLP